MYINALRYNYLLAILGLTSFAVSMTVNALVTGLIVFKIIKVFREVKNTVDDRILGMTGGSTLRRIIFVLTESGMLLFSIQIAQLVLYVVITYTVDDAADDAYELIVHLNQLQMLNVIIISVITMLNLLIKCSCSRVLYLQSSW